MNDNQRTITLVSIPKDVADAIELASEVGADNATVLHVRDDDFAIVGLSGAVLRSIPFDTLMSALINGYVIEKSAEELEREAHDKIRDAYAFHERMNHSYYYHHDGYTDGIRYTLDTLGIKIEGVNA